MRLQRGGNETTKHHVSDGVTTRDGTAAALGAMRRGSINTEEPMSWEIIKARETTDRHVQCDDGRLIQFTRWELFVFQVPACELCELEPETEEPIARAAA